MNPCAKFREPITLRTLHALDAAQTRALQLHLDNCPECRRHLEEISQLTAALRAAEPADSIQPSATFHRQLIAALDSAQRPPRWQTLVNSLAPLFTARAAMATAVVILTAGWLLIHRPAPPAPSPVAVSFPAKEPDLAPTFSNYERAVHQSLDNLDALLAAQAAQAAAPAPLYTAATRPILD